MHRVTVVLILAHKIEPNLVGDLYEQVCKQCGNEDEDCMVPCVVDLEHHTCVFNCLRVPYVGYNYAVKNRGIRIIKNRVFGGHLNLRGNEDYIAPVRDESLWDLWKELHHQLIGAERETKRRFEAMAVGEIRMEDQTLYLKWDNRGICQKVDMDAECRIAKVEVVTTWTYPKKQPIGKKTIQKIKSCIADYYAMQGYTVEFVE